MTAAVPSPEGNRNRADQLLAVTWVWCSLSLLLVSLRLYVRARITRNLWWDDWVMVFTMALTIAFSVFLTLYAAKDHLDQLGIPNFLYHGSCDGQDFRRYPDGSTHVTEQMAKMGALFLIYFLLYSCLRRCHHQLRPMLATKDTLDSFCREVLEYQKDERSRRCDRKLVRVCRFCPRCVWHHSDMESSNEQEDKGQHRRFSRVGYLRFHLCGCEDLLPADVDDPL